MNHKEKGEEEEEEEEDETGERKSGKEKYSGVLLYSRFQSHCEMRVQERLAGVQEEVQNEVQEEVQEVVEEVQEEVLEEVHIQIMEDLENFARTFH